MIVPKINCIIDVKVYSNDVEQEFHHCLDDLTVHSQAFCRPKQNIEFSEYIGMVFWTSTGTCIIGSKLTRVEYLEEVRRKMCSINFAST